MGVDDDGGLSSSVSVTRWHASARLQASGSAKARTNRANRRHALRSSVAEWRISGCMIRQIQGHAPLFPVAEGRMAGRMIRPNSGHTLWIKKEECIVLIVFFRFCYWLRTRRQGSWR